MLTQPSQIIRISLSIFNKYERIYFTLTFVPCLWLDYYFPFLSITLFCVFSWLELTSMIRVQSYTASAHRTLLTMQCYGCQSVKRQTKSKWCSTWFHMWTLHCWAKEAAEWRDDKQNQTWDFLCIFVKPKIAEQLAMVANPTRTFTIGIRDHFDRNTEWS